MSLMLRPLLVPTVSVGQAHGRGPAATFPVRLGLSFAAQWLWAGPEPCPALLSAVSRVPPLVLCSGLALHWPPPVLPWRQVEGQPPFPEGSGGSGVTSFPRLTFVFCRKKLEYSCLENSMDRGSGCSMVHRVTKSQTRLKQLSMHACIEMIK